MRLPVSRIVFISILALLLFMIVAELLLSSWITRKVNQKISEAGIVVESLEISLIRRSLLIKGFDWSKASQHKGFDSTFVRAREFTVKGIDIYQLLRNKSVRVRVVALSDGMIHIGSHRDTTSHDGESRPQLSGLEIETLRLVNTQILWKSDSATTWSGSVDGALHRIVLTDQNNSKKLSSYDVAGDAEIFLKDFKMKADHGFYSFSLARLNFNRGQHTLSCDSLTVTPRYSKLAFAHKRGTQSTWTALQIPRIEFRGVDVESHKDRTLTATKIIISDARIEAFRDRRVPLRQKSEVPLPMKWMRELGLAVEFDTISVSNMELVYEHIPEGGIEPGRFHLTGIDGTFLNVINRNYDNLVPVTTLNASAVIMGRGRIEASFTFPLNPGAAYEAKGHITKLPLRSLNPMLENAAFVSVESGYLNGIDFQFSYNNDVSNGRVKIDYRDLKLNGLKKGGETGTDPIKTFLANTAIRNTNSTNGEIHVERDKRRFIFNYWAKSLMDGVRNALVPVAGNGKKK